MKHRECHYGVSQVVVLDCETIWKSIGVPTSVRMKAVLPGRSSSHAYSLFMVGVPNILLKEIPLGRNFSLSFLDSYLSSFSTHLNSIPPPSCYVDVRKSLILHLHPFLELVPVSTQTLLTLTPNARRKNP